MEKKPKMILNIRKSLTESIPIWKKLAETGETKHWYDNNIKPIFGMYDGHAGVGRSCPLCAVHSDCKTCPLFVGDLDCDDAEHPYFLWDIAKTKKTRKKYARQILAILRRALRNLQKRQPIGGRKPSKSVRKRKPLGRSPSRKRPRKPKKK